MVGNMQGLAGILGSEMAVGGVVVAGREEVGVVSLPETDVDVESRGKRRDFHVVGPLARLAHLLDVLVKLLLQLVVGVVGGVEPLGCRSRLAFGIAAHVVDGHVLAVKVCILLHMLYGGYTQRLVQMLVATQLVGQGVEQAVALHGVSSGHAEKGLGAHHRRGLCWHRGNWRLEWGTRASLLAASGWPC